MHFIPPHNLDRLYLIHESCKVKKLQWNLSKADTIGTNKIVHYREGVLWRGVSAKRGSTLKYYECV